MTDVVALNAAGQQLFFADMARNKEAPPAAGPKPVRSFCAVVEFPVAHEQLVFFEVVPDLSVRLRKIPPLSVPGLAGVMDQAVVAHGTQHGWSETLQSAARRSIRMLLSIQHTPGRRVKDSEVEWLRPLQLYTMTLVRDVLSSIDMFEDDSEAPLESWFREQMRAVHPQITDEVTVWFHAIRDGRTCGPRMRRRSIATVRHSVADAKAALLHWTNIGYTSLREVERSDVLGVLPDDPYRQHRTAGALRSLFRFLKANKVVFINPTARVKAVRVQLNDPLPMDITAVRRAFNSDNPAGAAIAAIVIFHGLSTSQLAALHLSDVQDGRLMIGTRSIVLATPVQDRITAWLDVRNSRWPSTVNPHVFVNKHTALRTTPVSSLWISKKLPIPVRKLREDRILNEAIASNGDARVLGDLFGITTGAAERYTHAVEQDVLFSS